MKKGFPIRVPNPKISAKQNPPTWCLALLSLLWCSSLSCLLVGLCLPARAFAGALCAGWGLVLGLGVVVCAYCRDEEAVSVSVRILFGCVVDGCAHIVSGRLLRNRGPNSHRG